MTMDERQYRRELEIALQRYKDFGFSIIPIRPPDSDNDGKRPAIAEWMPYMKQAPKPELVDYWFKNPLSVAVITGTVSNLTVVDIDDMDSYNQLMLILQKWPTMTVSTGKGMHLYYRPTKETVGQKTVTFNLNGNLHHMKQEGSYVVAPPSRHKSGRMYTLANYDAPLEVSMNDLMIAIKESGAVFASQAQSTKPIAWASELTQPLNEGGRNNAAAQLCGLFIRHFRNDPGFIMGMMHAWNNEYCKPPLTERELQYLVETEYRRYKDRE